MRMAISKEVMMLALVVGFVAAMVTLARPTPTAALPDYAAKTGQACGTCHVNTAGGGPRTPLGQRFEAIATHTTDPVGAFAQAQAAAQPTPTTAPAKPAATATPAPAKPAATATPAPAKPAATPTAAPAPGALPRTGGIPIAPFAVGGGAFLLALGWTIRRILRS